MADSLLDVFQAFEKRAPSLQDGMHTRYINCCGTLFFPTGELLFTPLWQLCECLLGSPCCRPQQGDGPQLLRL